MSRVRKHLNVASGKSLAVVVMLSRLDYFREVPYTVAGVDLDKLRRVQDTMACSATMDIFS